MCVCVAYIRTKVAIIYVFCRNFPGPGIKPAQERNLEYLEEVAVQTARFVNPLAASCEHHPPSLPVG